jgi:hypothetical protein
MKKHGLLIEQFESLGFTFLPGQKINTSTGSYFVCNESRGTDVEALIAVRYLSWTQRYAFDFGFNSPAIRSFFLDQMPNFSPEMKSAADQMNKERPFCWFTLPMIWESINYRLNLNTKESDLTDLFSGPLKSFTEQVLLPVRFEKNLLDVYLSDIPPFEWKFSTSYFARFCQIAYLVSCTKSGFELAERRVSEQHRSMQASDLYGAKLKESFFQELVEFIQEYR